MIGLRQGSYAEAACGRPSLLSSATHVYVQQGAVSGLLENSYSWPYKVVERESKIVLLQLGDPQEWVSADSLNSHTWESPVAADLLRRGRPLRPQDWWWASVAANQVVYK